MGNSLPFGYIGNELEIYILIQYGNIFLNYDFDSGKVIITDLFQDKMLLKSLLKNIFKWKKASLKNVPINMMLNII